MKIEFSDSGHNWNAVLPTPTGVVSESGWVVSLRRQVVVSGRVERACKEKIDAVT